MALLLVFVLYFVNLLRADSPAAFDVVFHTTVKNGTSGTIKWCPNGVDRFFELLSLTPNSYYQDNAFFRVVPGFMVQFGISGSPATSQAWEYKNIPDDPRVLSNLKGTLVFATAGPNTRTTQLFINYVDNVDLDGQGFTPFGKIADDASMNTALAISSQYGQDPVQTSIYSQGNFYLKAAFPNLDYVIKTEIVTRD